jgi:DNA polymerase III subunit delta'
VSTFETFPEQAEAKRLLRAALAEGPVHAYLFHGPAGVGKRRAALAFAGELLASPDRAARETHPDLYVLELVGDQIRIDEIRALRRDLHMRPFEAERRVYLILGAELLNDEAADALLKDLEEPPAYAVLVLVADDLGPMAETIRSRCQPVPFTRLSERAVRDEIAGRAPGLDAATVRAYARVAAGRLDRAEALLDPEAARRRGEILDVARSVYTDPAFDASEAAGRLLELAKERARDARETEEKALEGIDLAAREGEQRTRRAARGAEREQLLTALEELAAWYRDLVVVAAGAESAVVHADRVELLREDATRERALDAERAAEAVRELWRTLEEFNLAPALALEALFVRLKRAFSVAQAA